MTGQELNDLRARADSGDRDAVDQLIEIASEQGDMAELRRLAAGGSRDAAEVLAEFTEGENDDSQ
jgi:hypothetical protein